MRGSIPAATAAHASLPHRAVLVPLLGVLALCGACAPRARAEIAPAPPSSQSAPAAPGGKAAPPSAKKPSTSASETTAAPSTQQRVVRALDPDAGTDPCGGYAFDGVTLGTTQASLAPTLPLVPLSHEEGMIEGFEGRIFGFRAARPGRVDDVQLGFTPGDAPVVGYIYARILVAETDAWPRTLFDRLGSPKNARIGEWIWWDMRCGTTLRLTQIETLGGGSGLSYNLEVRHTLKPAE